MFNSLYRNENAWVRVRMSLKGSLDIEQPHQVSELNVHFIQSFIEPFGFQLVGQAKIMQTPRGCSQVKKMSFGPSQ